MMSNTIFDVYYSVQLFSHVQLFVTPWTAACQASLSTTNCRSLLKLMSITLVMSSKDIFHHSLLLLPSIFPSIRVFSDESVLRIRWPMYWSFSINPFKEYSGLISFRVDWFDLLSVQGTLKNLLQHHSYERLNDNKTDNLEEVDRFLEKFNLPRLNQEEIEIMNKSITSTKIETVFKISQKQKPRTRWFHRILANT